MSGHLMSVAGYLDLPRAHKLALMKLCDSADDQTRIAFPGLEAVRLFAGTKRSRTLEILKDLQTWGFVMQVQQGRRGKRAEFKVFPNPGDEAFSLAARRGQQCPGVDRFVGPPVMPTPDEIKARVKEMDQSAGSSPPDPAELGPISRTLSTGSSPSDPVEQKGSDFVPRKGPISEVNGSSPPDPFPPSLPSSPSSSSRTDTGASTARDNPSRPGGGEGGGPDSGEPVVSLNADTHLELLDDVLPIAVRNDPTLAPQAVAIEVLACVENGWSVDELRRRLDGAESARFPGAVVLSRLRNLSTQLAPPAPPKLRAWCGEQSCNEVTRRREHQDDGRDLGPCPTCHPSQQSSHPEAVLTR